MYQVEEIRKIISPIAARYGVQRLFLFGSYARGDCSETSDVDLRVDKGRVKGLQMVSLHDDLEDALHCPVDLLSTSSLDETFLASIRKEEKLLYEQS